MKECQSWPPELSYYPQYHSSGLQQMLPSCTRAPNLTSILIPSPSPAVRKNSDEYHIQIWIEMSHFFSNDLYLATALGHYEF
jgi:hypothetical protein